MDFYLSTSKNALTARQSEGTLYVKSVMRNGRERVAEGGIALPSAYVKNGERQSFSWTLEKTLQSEGEITAFYSDENVPAEYLVSFKARADLDGAIEYSACLTNTGDGEIRIYPGTLFSMTYAFDRKPTAWRFMKESGLAEGMPWSKGKDHFDGTGIYKDVLHRGDKICAVTTTVQDFNAGGMIPMVYLDAAEYGAYIGVEWTSDRIFCEGTDVGVHVCVDYGEGFTTLLPAGEVFTVAPVYIGFYDGDVDDGSNLFKRWFFLEKTPKNVLHNEREPLVQEDDFGQLSPEAAKEHGIRCIKWDYGWWSNDCIEDPPTLWKYNEGSWKLRADFAKKRIEALGCKTLSEYGRYLESLGLEWTVYLLLHDCLCETEDDDLLTSVGKNAHPEWFTDVRIAGICPTADLGNKDCVEYCKRKLYEFLKTNHVSGWRTDFEPIARSSDKKNRHDANGNDVQYWCSRGFYEIVDHLIENLPGFRYESCSSGGSMKDYATMRRATIFNNDDSADFASLRTSFYDSSYCFPPAQLQWPLKPLSFCPEQPNYYCGYGDRDFGFRSLISAPVMLGSWNGSTEYFAYYKEYLLLHNAKIKHLIRHANLYHTLPRPDGIHWDGIQYGMDHSVNGNKIHGAAFIFKPSDKDGDTKHIKIRGLCPDAMYKADFYERKAQSFIASGKEIMEKGITVYMDGVPASDIIFFEQI